ncbi:MAG TPA: hypothetical protein VFB22_04975 [Candidatus Baltobacteraceae bacterium]|nr:hypothetical protein [Candidatus Baltobacteraceae bacterium]
MAVILPSDRVKYQRGLTHLLNAHKIIGRYTIRQVVSDGQALQDADARARHAALERERRAQDAAAEARRRRQEAAENAGQARPAAIAADQPTGSPSCLKLKS